MNLDGEFQQQQEQGNSGEYVLQEYLYNQLPIYFFLIAGVVRYKEIIDKPIKVTPEQHEKQKYNKAIISHIIKKQLSKTVAILYLVSTTMSLVLPNTTTFYYGARHKWGSLVYFLASCTWFFSIQVLKLEYFRELSQSLYCHRIFWPFSACFQIISIFQDYKGILNIVFNVSKALPETLLMFYAIYKPYDDIQQYIENQGDLPTFARQFIEKLESNRIVFFILGIKNQPLNDLEETLMPDENNLGQKIDISELQNYIPKQKYQQVEQERYLFNQLPRVAIAINQKIIVKQENSQQRFYYHIITQIGQNKYDTQQNYQEILNLESELHKIYKDVITKKFPKLEKTKMLSHESQEQYLSRRIQVLEQWFKLLIKEPLFMHQILLEFLNVDQNDQHPFITYFKLVVNTNPQYFSNIGLQAINNPAGGQINDPKFSTLNSNNQNQNQKSSSSIEMANLEFNRKKKKDRFQKAIEERKDDMEFDVSCTGFEKGKYGIWEFVIHIQYYSQNYPDVPLVWRINKSFTDIKDFNEKLEYELSSMNQIYRNNLSHLEQKNKNDANELQEKQQGIDKYMKFLLDNKYYWVKLLFTFIEFDVINEKYGLSQLNTPRDSYNASEQYSRNNSKKQFDIQIPEININQEFDTNIDSQKLSFPNKNKRISQGIDFNRVKIKVQKIFYKNVSQSDENNIFMHLYLQEYFNGESQKKKKIEIRVKKNYKEIDNLNFNIKTIYFGLGQNLPELPRLQSLTGTYTPNQFKLDLEQYFEKVLNLKQIQNNTSFLKFFNLQNQILTSSFDNFETKVFDYIPKF